MFVLPFQFKNLVIFLMDYYASFLIDNENKKNSSNDVGDLTPSLEANNQWPSKVIVQANVWPNFLWRSHSHQWVGQNICFPIQASFPELVDLLPIQLLFSMLYLLIWLSAIVGNASVLYVVSLKQVQLSSVRSVFICSLATSDILMSLTSLPITAISIFTRDWVFPSPFCKLMGIFQGGPIFVSSFTMTVIAVDRYILIKQPIKQKIEFRTAICIVVTVWTLGYACALPVGIFSSIQQYHPFCGTFCEENWPDTDEQTGRSRFRKMYGLLVLIVQFGLPTVISSLCYWSIGRLIRHQIQKRKERQIILPKEIKNRLNTQKNRTNRMMVTMVAGLVLAWLPMNLINLWRDFNSENSANSDDAKWAEWYSLIFAACHSVAMTSAVWNPLIYSFFNPQFKETIRACLERRRQSQAVIASLMAQQSHQQGNTTESRRTSARSLSMFMTNSAIAAGRARSVTNNFFASKMEAKHCSSRKPSAQICAIEEEKNAMLTEGEAI